MIVTDDAGIRRILETTKTIAIVGLSPKEDRPSNGVARFLMARGYTVIPVNPGQSEILGQPCYASLKDIPVKVDMLDVFRNAADVPPIAAAAGLDVVIDRCPKIEYPRVMG